MPLQVGISRAQTIYVHHCRLSASVSVVVGWNERITGRVYLYCGGLTVVMANIEYRAKAASIYCGGNEVRAMVTVVISFDARVDRLR